MTLLLDLLILKPTAFFLNILNSNNLLLIILYGLIIDYQYAYTKGLITIFLLNSFILHKLIKNYYLFNILISLIFYIIFFKKILIISFIYQIIFIILNHRHILKW